MSALPDRAREQPFFDGTGDSRLFAFAHHPVGASRGNVVFCHAFAEEKLWSHRVYVTFARELAQAGYGVLRFDMRGEGDSGRELSRTFKTFDHRETDGVEGFVTVTGGKATTLRAIAELCADVVCRKLDLDAPCRTRETVLLPHTAYYAAAAA